jgi:hypothetical protein
VKIAIAIHGNLRTFFMPLREAPHIRLCDLALNNIILPNLGDVFIMTDSNDFYYNGKQYFSEDKQIEITNSDSFRLHKNIAFELPEICEDIISTQLNKTIPNIKQLKIERYYDCTADKKYNLLMSSGARGASPSTLIGHYRKLKLCNDMITEHENKNNIKYDAILKIRFDNLYPYNRPLIIKNFTLDDNNVYGPGYKAKFFYDWFAFGKKNVMDNYLNLYDNLGFTLKYPSLLVECNNCGVHGINGTIEIENQGWKDICPLCKKNGKIWVADVTLSPEYHLYKTFELKNIKLNGCDYYSYVYRYLDLSTNITLEEIFSANNLKGKTLINHSPHPDQIKITKI